MTEAETIVLLNKKQQELAEKRLANASSDTLKVLEEEIKDLALTLASRKEKPEEERVFIDECAG
jgi:hypothetical protein